MNNTQENIPILEESNIKLPVDIGLIGRFDNEILEYKFKRVLIPTPYGLMDRAFYGKIGKNSVLIIYGRFDKKRTISEDIDFMKTQAAFNAVGAKTIIGTFVTGGIQKSYEMGDVFIVSDFFGMGGYRKSLYLDGGFKNIDMYKPFCEEVRGALVKSAKECDFKVYDKGIYMCFHGYPRIETKAEVDFFERAGFDIAGQTLDAEATLARESGCCYAAVAVIIDDPKTRDEFMEGDTKARQKTQNAIPEGRLKTAKVVFDALKNIPTIESRKCVCNHKFHSEKSHFRYLPDFILDSE